jgi:hypothetical protein
MVRTTKSTLYWILCLVCLSLSIQVAEGQESKSTTQNTKKSYTTDDYFGVYKGDLKIRSKNGGSSIPMELHLLPTDIKNEYKYTLVYIVNGERQERLYTLKRIDAANGIYVLDENNGITIDAVAWDNKLYMMFEVEGSLLTTQLTFEGDQMIFEITFTRKDAANKSATTDEKSIEVLSYPVSTIQKAILKKQ